MYKAKKGRIMKVMMLLVKAGLSFSNKVSNFQRIAIFDLIQIDPCLKKYSGIFNVFTKIRIQTRNLTFDGSPMTRHGQQKYVFFSASPHIQG